MVVSADPDSHWSIYQLVLLTASYVFGELSHFLIGVTSRDVARDVHYGDQACFPKQNRLLRGHDNSSSKDDDHDLFDCTKMTNESR